MRFLNKILHLVKSLFVITINKEFIIFLVFLAISTSFWFVMALNETYEREIGVPLRITEVPENVIITEGVPDTVRIVVRDKGYFLFTYFYGDAISEVALPFKQYAKSNGKGNVPVSDLQKLIYPMLSASTRIVSVKADKLEFYYNYGLSKRVPVLFDGDIKAVDGYFLARTKCTPESVTIYASRQQLDSINEVFTENLMLEEFRDTVVQTLSLRKISGVKIVPKTVSVTLYGDRLTEKTFSVPVVPSNMPAGFILRTFPSTVNVKVVAGLSRIASLKSQDFRVIVDYKELEAHPSDKCHLVLSSVPKGVTSATLETSTADYLIEKQE